MNKVTLIGRMARPPEIKRFEGGGTIANLRVITHRSWRDKATNELRERSDGHTVAVHHAAAAERLAQQLDTGDLVLVEGLLENRSWTKDGNKQWITEVVVRPGMGTVRRLAASAKNSPQGVPHDGTAPIEGTQDALPVADDTGLAQTDDLFAQDEDSDGFDF